MSVSSSQAGTNKDVLVNIIKRIMSTFTPLSAKHQIND